MSDGQVTLRMLGGIELITPDGLPARTILAQPRRLAVLLYLAAANPRGFHRKDLVRVLFWPDADGLHARQALNRAIYVLRHALGPGAVATRGDDEVGIGERVYCDVIRFERALGADDHESALELYRGDLAPGFMVSGLPEFERWMEAERARLRGRAVHAAMGLAVREELSGRLESAERWAHRAESLAPYDERASVRRMELLDRMGDRAAALRVFEELERRLKVDLEVEPSPETAARVESLRARRAARRPVDSSQTEPSAPDQIPDPAAGVRPDRLRRLVPLVTGLLLLLVVSLSSMLMRSASGVLTTSNAVRITSEAGIELQPSLSPDGHLVAFTTFTPYGNVIAVRSTAGTPGSGEIRPVPSDSDNQELPTWSSDGETVRYASILKSQETIEPFPRPVNGAKWRWNEVDQLGGHMRATPFPLETQWAAWSRDGSRAAFAVRESVFVLDSAAARPRLLAVHPAAWGPHSLAWSPNNRWIAYVEGNLFWVDGWNSAPSTIWLVDTERGERIQVTDGMHLNVSPAWLDARHLMFVSDLDGQREVFVVQVGPSGPRGRAVKVPGGTDAHSISLSADGRRMAMAKSIGRQNVWSFPLGGSRPLLAHEGQNVTGAAQVVETHDVSPDGRWLAYDTDRHGDADIYLMRLDGGTPVPLVTGPGSTYSPRFSPDGKEIAYYGGDEGDVWVIPTAGGSPTRLTDMPGSDENPLWSPDGLSIAFRAGHSGRAEAWIVARDRVGGSWSRPRQLTDFGCAFLVWAGDGSGVICGWPKSSVMTLVAPNGAVRWRRDFRATGLTELGQGALSVDGTTLYLRGTRGAEAGIWALPLSGAPPRLVVPFAHWSLRVQSYPGTINVTRDRLYLTIGEFESDIWAMDLVRR